MYASVHTYVFSCFKVEVSLLKNLLVHYNFSFEMMSFIGLIDYIRQAGP